MREKEGKKSNEQLIVIGKHPVIELLQNGKPVQKVFILRTLKGTTEIDVRKLTNEAGVPLVRVDNYKLDKLSNNKNHQGLVALTSPISFQKIEDIIPHIYESDQTPLILILDHITDVRNFGAIARSALALGVHAIIIPSKGTAAINKDAIKSSAGAVLDIPICRMSNLVDAIKFLKDSGIATYSSTLRDAKNISDIDLTIPTALVIGSEDHGVDNTVIKVSDELFKIPQSDAVDSLNVSVATGIILYEVNRQRSLS